MTSLQEASNNIAGGWPQPSARPLSSLVPFHRWLKSIGRTPATGWRWRRDGLIVTQNVCGRVFVSRQAIADFERRAASGEFASEHKTPKRISSQTEAKE